MNKILIFSTAYYPFVGGAEIAVKEITDRLKRSDFAFDMVTIRFDKTLPEFEKIGNVNVYRISSSKLLFPFRAFFTARRFHKRNNYSFIWSIMVGRAGFAALFFKYAYPDIPFLLTLQEGDRLDYPKEQAGILWFAVGGLFKKIFIKADFIQAISRYLGRWARDMGYDGALEIIPNGADIEKFKNQKSKIKIINQSLKNKLGINKNEKVIIHTGRLVEKNAVGDIIKALVHLPENIKLLIIGKGSLLETLQKEARNLNLAVGERVLFLDYIDHNNLPQYLHISDVFARPSLSEGMGNSFIEAMAAGIPVIATPVGGIVDFLKDRETGLFCEVRNPASIADKINLLLTDKALRDKIVMNAEKMATEKYDWDLIAKNMKEKIFDILTKQ